MNGEAKHIVRFWGGGREIYFGVRPPNPVLEAAESGIRLICAHVPCKENDRAGTNGRKTYHRWGGGRSKILGVQS